MKHSKWTKDLEKRFGLKRVRVVGDRGMVSPANLEFLSGTALRYLLGVPGRRCEEAVAVLEALDEQKWEGVDESNRVQEVALFLPERVCEKRESVSHQLSARTQVACERLGCGCMRQGTGLRSEASRPPGDESAFVAAPWPSLLLVGGRDARRVLALWTSRISSHPAPKNSRRSPKCENVMANAESVCYSITACERK